MQNWELKLVEDIFGQCNNDIDCPKGLICEKNACTKPGPVPIGIICIHTEFPNISYLRQLGLIIPWSTQEIFAQKSDLEKYFFGLNFTDFQTVCQKESKSDI